MCPVFAVPIFKIPSLIPSYSVRGFMAVPVPAGSPLCSVQFSALLPLSLMEAQD
jgi:hypothetical protein